MPKYLDIFSDLGIQRDYLTEEPEAIPTGTDRWEITKGVISGVDQLQAIGGGLVSMVGDVVGVDSLRDWGIETYKRNIEEAKVSEARIGRYEDIENIGDAFDYMMHGIGSALPMFLPSMVSGGVGAIAARKAAESGVKKFLSERISKSVATGLTEKAAAKLAAQQGAKYASYGLGAGVGVGSVGLETGSIFGKIQAETGEFRPGVAVSHGAIAGVLDALPIGRVLNRLGVGQQAKQKITGEIQDGAASYIGKQILAEAGTEGIQTIIERHAVKWVDDNKAIFTSEGWSEIINATLLGGVAGGALAAPTSLTKQIFEEIESDVADIGQSTTADEAIIKGSNIIDSEVDSLARRDDITIAGTRIKDLTDRDLLDELSYLQDNAETQEDFEKLDALIDEDAVRLEKEAQTNKSLKELADRDLWNEINYLDDNAKTEEDFKRLDALIDENTARLKKETDKRPLENLADSDLMAELDYLYGNAETEEDFKRLDALADENNIRLKEEAQDKKPPKEVVKKDLVSPLEKTIAIKGLPEAKLTQLETQTLEDQATKLRETKIEDLTDSQIRTEIDNIVSLGSSRIVSAEKGEAQRILPDERDFTAEESARLDSLVKEENTRRDEE
jgi:hypothetical protein